MWGQEVFDVIDELMDGIIPTRVGTSETHKSERLERRDHPHACGDKLETLSRRACISGSSPRVWGQAELAKSANSTNRIIPTRVGTSLQVQQTLQGKRDHPHACGDKPPVQGGRQQISGSSPRVWGQVRHFLLWSMKSGIIPTRVGTSLFTPKNTRLWKDHPHACGDKGVKNMKPMQYSGSSPRVWGQVYK